MCYPCARKIYGEKLPEKLGVKTFDFLSPEQLEKIEQQVTREIELEDLQDDLTLEVHHWNSLLKIDSTQFHRRAFIRSAMAFIEGSSFAIRELLFLNGDVDKLDITEQAFLQNKKVELQSDGTIKAIKRGFHSTAPLMLLTIRCYAKANQVEYIIETKSEAFDSVKAAFNIRNELAHPKEWSKIQISELDLSNVRLAYNWYFMQINGIDLKIYRRLLDYVRESLDTLFTPDFQKRLQGLLNRIEDMQRNGLLE